MAVSVLCLFLAVPWVGLLSVVVKFTGHNHMLVYIMSEYLDYLLTCQTVWSIE